ncbi:hypothetical protein FACS1894211_11370 [Clostridia bacterium]|nr:hypothetical protein FACS1894211_11370 [Clostridia bacterium]
MTEAERGLAALHIDRQKTVKHFEGTVYNGAYIGDGFDAFAASAVRRCHRRWRVRNYLILCAITTAVLLVLFFVVCLAIPSIDLTREDGGGAPMYIALSVWFASTMAVIALDTFIMCACLRRAAAPLYEALYSSFDIGRNELLYDRCAVSIGNSLLFEFTSEGLAVVPTKFGGNEFEGESFDKAAEGKRYIAYSELIFTAKTVFMNPLNTLAAVYIVCEAAAHRSSYAPIFQLNENLYFCIKHYGIPVRNLDATLNHMQDDIMLYSRGIRPTCI